MVGNYVLVLGILGLFWENYSCARRYDNYTLLKITPYNNEQVAALASFPDDPYGEIEFLKTSRGVNQTSDVLVSAAKLRTLKRFAKKTGMRVKYKHNYGRFFKSVHLSKLSGVETVYNFSRFNTYKSIENYLKLLSETSDLVTIQHMGQSYENRKIQLVKISASPERNNPIIFIDAGIHAREWVTPAMAMYLIDRLTGDPAALRKELDGLDWYILPVVNPDGYEFSRSDENNRLWRKTRSKTSVKMCLGVDGNRNFDYEWGAIGVSHDPCDHQIYCGPAPFSEVETQIVRNIMLSNAKRIKLYVTLHSYGNYLLYPWSYTSQTLPKGWKRFHKLALIASDAVQRAGGQPLEVMSAGQWYLMGGSSTDYAFGRIGIPYSYILELTDGFKFTFPDELLEIIYPRYYDAFKVFAVQIRREFSEAVRRENIK